MEEVEVSIICNTYNHEKYIEDALKSFLIQKTNFKFEILVHDDASTDRTQEIIRKYENKYPNIIKPIYQKENQYSKDPKNIEKIQTNRIRGKYVAICEGDDFWSDENKLQMQYDILEKNPKINICSHSVRKVKEDGTKTQKIVRPQRKDTIISVEQVISGGGGLVGTSSLFIRSSFYKNQPKFIRDFNLDYFIQISNSLPNGMYYIDKIMSSYRLESISSVTKEWSKNRDIKLTMNTRIIEMLKKINEETNGKYNNAILEAISLNEYEMLIYDRNYKEMKNHPYFKKISLKDKFKIYVKDFINYKK